MGRPAHFLVGQLDGHVGGEELHLGAGHHHLAETELARGENLIDDAAFLLPQGRRFRNHLPQFLVTHGVLGQFRIAAEDPHHRIGGNTQEPDDGPGQGRDAGHQRGQRQREPLGPLHGEAFRAQLPDHYGEVGNHDRDDHQGQRIGHRGGNPPALEDRGEPSRQGRPAEGR